VVKAILLVVPFKDIYPLGFSSLKPVLLYHTQYPRPPHVIEPRIVILWYLIFIKASIKHVWNQKAERPSLRPGIEPTEHGLDSTERLPCRPWPVGTREDSVRYGGV